VLPNAGSQALGALQKGDTGIVVACLEKAIRMENLKRYFLKYFEQVFVLLVLVSTAFINYFIPQKLAFLNFYFIPVILGAYYLGRRMGVMGALMCLLMVTAFVILEPGAFLQESSEFGTYLHITIWGGFLILAGAVVGRLKEVLAAEVEAVSKLNQSLEENHQLLDRANAELRDYSDNLEQRVQQRTVELEESKAATEALKKKVEAALYSTMDSSVVNLMIEGRLRNEKRPLSVMFSDLVGFTTYSENTAPENVVAELNRYLADMEPVLLSYHAHIDKYMGDGIMCEFGAPLEFSMHRLMAVVAATKMQEAFARSGYPWQMRIGIASGPAITGLIGSKRQTYTAIGDIVNLAARLEKHCTPGRVLVDSYTYEDVKPFFDARKVHALPHRNIDLKKEQELERLHEQLLNQPEAADLIFRMGEIYMQIEEPVEALAYFERALQLDGSNTAFKLAYAEAGLEIGKHGKLTVKGKRQRVEAYELLGMKDPLANTARIPRALYDSCKQAVDEIKIPSDVTLPSEVLDGSVGHSRVVAALSYALASRIGLLESQKLEIMRAGFLADIGKEMIPNHILNRSGALTPSERDIINQHPDEACRMMRKMGYDDVATLAAVRHSHERFDGTGYPDCLKADNIPIGARIIAVADSYDALTAWRAYRASWERSAVLGELQREVEKGAFDPAVVAALAQLLG